MKGVQCVQESIINTVNVVDSRNKAVVEKAAVIVEETSRIEEKAITLYRDSKNNA